MKFRRWEWIVLLSLIALALISSAASSLWTGFSYFTTSLILAFLGFFINNRIYYIKLIKKDYDEGLGSYFAELYNNNLITKEQFDKADPRIVFGYYEEYRRSKNINICIIVGLAFLSISIISFVFNIW